MLRLEPHSQSQATPTYGLVIFLGQEETMSEKIVQLNEEVIKGQLKELVRGSVEETLNELLKKEADQLTQAAR